MPKYAQVIIDFATIAEIDHVFTYIIEEQHSDKVQIGQRVKVPFGKYNALQTGYVIGISENRGPENYPLKAIFSIVDPVPLLSAVQLDIAHFIVAYYGTSYAAALEAVTPPGLGDKPFVEEPDFEEYIMLTEDLESVQQYIYQNKNKKTFSKQRFILEYLLDHPKVCQKELEAAAEFSRSSLKTLLQHHFIIREKLEKNFVPDRIRYEAFKPLNDEQEKAKTRICEAVSSSCYRTLLLQGVTGSGKTEVFLYAIKEVLESGGSAIILVPEIALTKQTLERFKERFGNRAALIHSRMTPKERQNLYLRAKSGKVSIVIGPRSAVFMPLGNLKLIVIDEEHEATYKSESMPKYHAADIAKMRMQKEGGVVLLASATPSIETYYQSEIGNYDKVMLKRRIGDAELPEVITVDMRLELREGNHQVISQRLYEGIKKTLDFGQQVMLLINRRGHSTFINCRSCGHVIKCEHCDVAMTYHLSAKSLECHYCGKKLAVPDKCPACESKYIRFFGSGTEKIEEFLKQHFEAYGIARMDLDTTGGKEGHHKILDAFANREVNLLIGTQMIAKGHDFKDVALVGIIAADMSLFMQDFRSSERTFQLITQAMGRAGRSGAKGQVIIQTYNPDHIVLQRIKYNKQELFYKEELSNRQLMGYPPFEHIFTVLVTGKNEQQVIKAAYTLAQYYRHYSQKGQTAFRVIGPSAAVLGKLVDEYRWRIIILSSDREKLLIYGKYCLRRYKDEQKAESIKVQWDIDPLSMM